MIKNFTFVFILFFAAFIRSQSDSLLILNEVMFYPTSGNNEFVEVYNLSAAESFDLAGYKFKYSASSTDVFIDAGFGTVLPPLSYAVILEGDYDFVSGIYNSIIPSDALILKISDNSFGSSGMSNTEDRIIKLINPSDDTLQVYTYSANNSQSFSDEKISLSRDNTIENWANAITINGTPGFENSVTPVNYDLQLSSITVSPDLPFEGDDVQIDITIKNIGILSAGFYSIEVYNDLNLDSIPEANELFYSNSFSNLLSGDSTTTSTNLTALSARNYQIIAQVVFTEDENNSNNQKIKLFTVFLPGANFNDVVINEIMYAPVSGEPEWVELFNRSLNTINLKKWKLSDALTAVSITPNDFILQPDSFVVLSKDSSIINFYNIPSSLIVFSLPALNNSGDAVVLKDSIGFLVDSLFYLPDWGGSIGGNSLERILAGGESNSSENWGTSESIDRATPGKINSLSPKDYDLSIINFSTEKDFVILGEQAQFDIKILNKGLNSSQTFQVEIFNDANADSIPQPSEFATNFSGQQLSSGDSTSFVFTSSDFSAGKNYFITKLITSIDDDTTNNIAFESINAVNINEIRNDIVINEIMYAPDSPEPEWIELFNQSNKIIDLKNYQLSDNSDTTKIISQSTILNPSEYFVIADDSLLLNIYNITSQLVVKSFSAFNNTGDKIILLDSLDRVIDSLEYSDNWGGSEGNSLERINAEFSSTDSSNWKTSSSRLGATPGFINSVTRKDFDIEASDILFTPAFPQIGENVTASIKIKNIGKNPADFSFLFYEDTNLDSIPDLLLETKSGFNLPAGDSSNIPINYSILNLESKRAFFIRAIFIFDQDTTNNFFYKAIAPGFPPLTILINEIMYSPLGGEPEWIEIYNTSEDTINLNSWSVADVLTTSSSALINNDFFVAGKSYSVITEDTSIFNFHRVIPSKVYQLSLPSFNNDADGVVLRDNRGAAIDSVFYSSDWGGTGGYSLERISFDAPSNLFTNWNSSIDIETSTPGRINSLTPKQFDLSIISMLFNPKYPTEGEDVFINAQIRNNGSSAAQNFNLQFFIDSDSNEVADQLLSEHTITTLAAGDSFFVQSSSPIVNLNKKILCAVKIIFSTDEDTLNNYFEKSVQPGFAEKSVLISEVMSDPADGEPEWVEIINNSNDTINLKNWSISDVLTKPTKSFISSDDYLFAPSEFLVIAPDTSFKSFHPDFTGKFIAVNFGTLTNSADGIIVYDFRDGIIDSLLYRSSWGGAKGVSLERFSYSASTNDSLNWATCLNANSSTPGKVNSLFDLPDYERNSIIINEIMFDPDIDNSEFIELLNLSADSINIGGWKIEDLSGNFYKLAETSFFLPKEKYFILAADSLMLKKYLLTDYRYKTLSGESSLGLLNSGEAVILKDVKGNIIDSVFYSDKWHNKNISILKNRSLERINPTLNSNDPLNWSTSVSNFGATPAEQNSIFTDNLNSTANISVSPNPFSPDNDGFEDFAIINYNLSQPVAQVRIKIFDSRGRLVRTLANNLASGSSGSIVFDGLEDDGQPMRIGIYIIFLEALNDNSGVVEILKTVVVVARKL
ncbi:MAG: lamin tail domain-containing protein [Ignavibacteriales bacterium]|nr:lamin tail domain-containing protein [Ignavibacteriales bacterium]